jgi:hypothetical protein
MSLAVEDVMALSDAELLNYLAALVACGVALRGTGRTRTRELLHVALQKSPELRNSLWEAAMGLMDAYEESIP